MNKIWLIVAFALLIGNPLSVFSNPQDLFLKGSQSQNEENTPSYFTKAAEEFIILSGEANIYNAALAYWKAGDIYHSVIQLRNSLDLNPIHDESLLLLKKIRNSQGIKKDPEVGVFSKIVFLGYVPEVFLLGFSALLILSLVVFSIYEKKQSQGKYSKRIYTSVAGLLALMVSLFLIGRTLIYPQPTTALINTDNVSLLETPYAESNNKRLENSRGLEVVLGEKKGRYVLVKTLSGEEGWIEFGSVRIF